MKFSKRGGMIAAGIVSLMALTGCAGDAVAAGTAMPFPEPNPIERTEETSVNSNSPMLPANKVEVELPDVKVPTGSVVKEDENLASESGGIEVIQGVPRTTARYVTPEFFGNTGMRGWDSLETLVQVPNGDLTAKTTMDATPNARGDSGDGLYMVELCHDIISVDALDKTVHRVSILDYRGDVKVRNYDAEDNVSMTCWEE